jgi:hypothetical protein
MVAHPWIEAPVSKDDGRKRSQSSPNGSACELASVCLETFSDISVQAIDHSQSRVLVLHSAAGCLVWTTSGDDTLSIIV